MQSSHRRYALRRRRGRIIAIAIVAVVALLAALLLWPSGSDAAVRAELEAAFDGAYPAEPPTGGEVVEFELVAAPAQITLVEGVSTDVWAFNGTVPGQALRVRLGDTVRVTLRNELPVGLTIHWHGVRVPNPMDGMPDVTQPYVQPGETFVYEFTPPDAGTFWYHSHVDSVEQVERGLYGTLVVEDADPAPYSQDVLWVLDDWSLTESGQLDTEFMDQTAVEHNGRWGSLVTVNGSAEPVLRARPGERVRLRMVNASVARPYALRFVDPPATLIAVDGMYLREPRSADPTVVGPGSRADFDLVMPDEPTTFEIIEDFSTRPEVLARVVVEGEPVQTPEFAPPSNPAVPDWSGAADVGIDIEYKLALRDGRWVINGRSFPDVDPKVIEPGRFIKIRFTNNSIRLHPMHLHGQFFQVLAVNGEPVDLGQFQDSVLLFKDDVVDVGLIALDEGTWGLHCHILEHAHAGMTTLLTVEPPGDAE